MSIGGSNAIDIVGGTLEVRWAIPNDGFRVTVGRALDGRELRVEFRSAAHRSRIDPEDGELNTDIDEDERT